MFGSVLFKHEAENNTKKKTMEKAVLKGADLKGADLKGAYLKGADLEGAYLKGADLKGAYLEGAYLKGADLEGADLKGADLEGADLKGADLKGADLKGAYLKGADLKGADLKGADLKGADLEGAKNIPKSYINVCSRDMLFIFEHLKQELPFLRKKLIAGKIDGTQYEGECACLIGTIANAKKNGDRIKTVCETIPFYEKGLHNLGEQWFYQIRKGDTPKNSFFAKHVLKLIDEVI